MDLEAFNEEILHPLMEKISIENKNIYLVGEFNVDLMKTEIDTQTSQLFDTITSNLFVPRITCPTRIATTISTLIDNIYSNSLNFEEGISGNLTTTISDHLAQFLILLEENYKCIKKQNLF